MLGFCLPWYCVGLVCITLVSLYVSCSVWETLFPWSHPPPLVLTVLLFPLPHRSLGLKRRTVIQTSQLGQSMPVAYSLHTGQLWVTVLTDIHCKRKLIYEYNNKSLGIALLVCSFSRIVISFHLGAIAYLVMDSWLHWKCWKWIPSKKWWVTLWIHASIITLVGISLQVGHYFHLHGS